MSELSMGAILSDYVIPWSVNIVLAATIFFVGKWLVKHLMVFVDKLLHASDMDQILINFVVSIMKGVLILFVAVAALDQLGVDTTSLIALVGAAGLAIGLSLQDSLKNFAAGVMLILFRPFKTGHWVEAGGVSGSVELINIFSTTMKTGDNKTVIVPNGAIYSGTITNYSARRQRRIDMVFGIGYDDDIKKAKEVMQSVIESDKRVLKKPETLIAVAELADSSVNFVVRPWVKTGDYWAVKFDLTERIKLAFDENGISIPYPQMDIHQDK